MIIYIIFKKYIYLSDKKSLIKFKNFYVKKILKQLMEIYKILYENNVVST